MARFTHPAIRSYGSTDLGTWTVEGGTDGDQPAFTGDPLFSGNWTLVDGLCHFAIDVDMDNIDDFGSGQYFMKLPFVSKNNYLFSDGCLHDFSGEDEYSILGHVVAGSDVMTLLSISSNGRQVSFEHNVPVTLAKQDNFHIAGTFEIDPELSS